MTKYHCVSILMAELYTNTIQLTYYALEFSRLS